MKSVLISIQPYWVFLIIAKKMRWNTDKEKTVEVRKNYPKGENWNKVVKMYCSKDKKSFAKIPKEYQPLMERFLGKVIGEFVCDKVEQGHILWVKEQPEYYEKTDEKTQLTYRQMLDYLGEKGIGYFWHISDLVIYDKPKELSEFFVYCDRCDKRPIACKFAYEESNENGYYSECMCDFKRPIERPPQSWCYVEEQG